MNIECDHCGQRLHHDINGWWVGPDETSDCPLNEGGHTWNWERR